MPKYPPIKGEVHRVKVELEARSKNNEKKMITLYDDTDEELATRIFASAIEYSKKLNMFSIILIPKSCIDEGVYFVTLYDKDGQILGKYYLNNEFVIDDISTKAFYKTDFLFWFYQYYAVKAMNLD